MKTLFTFLFILVAYLNLNAQVSKPLRPAEHKNFFYGYAGTTLVSYSTGVFYERAVFELPESTINLRGGVGVYTFLWGDYGVYYVVNACHVIGQSSHKFEYNLGYAIYTVPYDTYIERYPSAYVGYRYTWNKSKYLFRAGFGWPEQVSVSLGFAF